MKVHPKAGLVLCMAILGAIPAYASQNVDEVIKLSKGGSSAEVLVAFIEKSTGDSSVSADDIAAMDAAGVPAAAIEALLAKEGASAAIPVADAPVADNSAVAPTADNADISYFYDSMSHDGAWTKDTDNGWCWSPTVAVGNADWRPYVDNGSWVYTDDGWYWNSGYSWGWSAFHYGRWSHRENNWYWHPDNVWGSSWVSWRNNDGYYGWAPLTPRARFGSSGFAVGLTTGNFDLNIGLGERDYFFVHSNNFLERDLNHHRLQGNEVTVVYNNSTVSNHYTSNNNRFSNQGIPVKNVALATKQEIKPVTIVDHPAKAGEPIHAGGLQNGKLEVFRPTLSAKTSIDPTAAAARHTEAMKRAPANANVTRSAVVDARKAEAVKRVTERAAKEPRVTATTTRRDPTETKTVTPPTRVPELKTPTEHAPARVPETREPARTETPKTHEPVKEEPRTRPEQPARAEQPVHAERAEPKARETPPARAEQPARTEKTEKGDK